MSGRGGGSRDEAARVVRLPQRGGRGGGGDGQDGDEECLKYLDTLFREYLVYRGLTSTLASFNHELSTEPTAGFRPEAVCDLIFGTLIPRGDLRGLLSIMSFLRSRFYSRLDTQHEATVRSMDTSLLRLYVVTQWQASRSELVSQFFSEAGEMLLRGPDADSWRCWFALSHVDTVSREPHMQAYFTQEWAALAEVSFRNFLAQVFSIMPQPAVLRFNALRQQRKELQRQVEILAEENAALRETLADADRISTHFRGSGITSDCGGPEPKADMPRGARANGASAALSEASAAPVGTSAAGSGRGAEAMAAAGTWDSGGGREERHRQDLEGKGGEALHGHQAAVAVCRFSPGGEHVASGAADGTVRIWAPESLSGGRVSERRAASFQAGGAILSLDWDRRANKVMLVGTSAAGVKVWHLDTCRIVGEVRPEAVAEPMGHVLAIAASPTEAIFAASMATSAAAGWQAAGRLTLWNMRTFLKVSTLAIDPFDGTANQWPDSSGEEPAVVSLDFSGDGRLLGAACSDGSVRLFDIAAGRGEAPRPVAAWIVAKGHACSTMRFAPGGKSVLTLSGDGLVQEWSLATCGRTDSRPLSTFDAASHCGTLFGGGQSRSKIRHHFAVSCDGGSIALTSNTAELPVLHRTPAGWTLKTTSMHHGDCVTAVDWHPALGIIASGSDASIVSLNRLD